MPNSFYFALPSPILTQFIENYYFVEINGSTSSDEFEQKPVPNGCAEMFIGYHGTKGTCMNSSGNWVITDSSLVGAQKLNSKLKGIALDHESLTMKFVSVCFRQNGVFEIFKILPYEIYNGIFDSESVFGNSMKQLRLQLDTSKNNEERKKYLDSFFVHHLLCNSYKNYNFLTGTNIVKQIHNRSGNIRESELMNEFGVSERTLQRQLKAVTGMSPKEYGRIVRFRSLFDYISKSSEVNWLDMVAKFGYYDQSHLINEFRIATGLTPSVFMKYRNKQIFYFNNHISIVNPALVHEEVYRAIVEGQEHYSSFSELT